MAQDKVNCRREYFGERQVIARDFNIRDRKGRLVGARFTIQPMRMVPDPGSWWKATPGEYLECSGGQTRDGASYGSGTPTKRLTTQLEADQAAAAYLDGAEKRVRRQREQQPHKFR